MANAESQPLTDEQLRNLDALYEPFPSFTEWPKSFAREDLWDSEAEKLADASQEASSDQLDAAREIAFRTAAFDTGAIEGLYQTNRGLTVTVATQAAAWESTVQETSGDALNLFEAQLKAFELVLDLTTGKFSKVTQTWIRRVHEDITSAQDFYPVITPAGRQEQALPKGEYKHYPNHVVGGDGQPHAYAPVESTQSEMERFCDELDRPEFRSAHPVLQAAYAHYAFTVVHPFADGNGRTARAIASVFLYRATSVPLIVLAEERDRYLAALAKADTGESQVFIDLIARVGRAGLQLVTETLKAAVAPDAQEILGKFRNLYLAQGGLSHKELDGVAVEAQQALLESISTRVDDLAMPDGVEIKVTVGSGRNNSEPPPNFRRVVQPSAIFIRLELRSAPPGLAEFDVDIDIFASNESDTASTVALQAVAVEDRIELGLSDLWPAVSSTARIKLESFSARVIGSALAQLLGRAQRQLEQQGYR